MRDGRAQEAEERKIETRWERDGQRRERHALVEVGRERETGKERKIERTTHSILLFILSGKTKENDERLLRHARALKLTLNFLIRL